MCISHSVTLSVTPSLINVRIALVVSHPPPAAAAKPAYHAWYSGFADDERYTSVDQMQLDRVRFRRRIHQSELILAQ